MSHTQHMLLVEDNQNDVELMLAVLEEFPFANEVVVALDGAEALDYLFRREQFATRSEDLPCVVLLDIKMPKVNGFEVLKQIRTDAQLRWLPVVMLTSSRAERDIMESYALGANAYVVKPVDFDEYVEMVKDIGRFWGRRNEPPLSTAGPGGETSGPINSPTVRH
ncbi:MAG: response regulator [Deltaproteobacteria bacterium]|nr:response regulator [Deltaproteobacteria bacterium]